MSITTHPLIARLGAYEKLMRLDKPIGILLLLWPTLWGLWVASGGVPTFFVGNEMFFGKDRLGQLEALLAH